MTESLSNKLKLRILRTAYSQREHHRIDELVYKDVALEYVPTPNDIFRLNQQDPVVHAMVSHWLQGDLTWEQALMKCIMVLSDRTRALEKEKAECWTMSSPSPIYVTLHNREEDSE